MNRSDRLRVGNGSRNENNDKSKIKSTSMIHTKVFGGNYSIYGDVLFWINTFIDGVHIGSKEKHWQTKKACKLAWLKWFVTSILWLCCLGFW